MLQQSQAQSQRSELRHLLGPQHEPAWHLREEGMHRRMPQLVGPTDDLGCAVDDCYVIACHGHRLHRDAVERGVGAEDVMAPTCHHRNVAGIERERCSDAR